ncbi:MAG: DUF58 domain-containing protein [Haloarculaceae archaeon]
MRPTRRGYGLALVVLLALAFGLVFGARALDAVAIPSLVALGASAYQLHRADPPALDRSQPESGFPGETRTVDLAVETSVPCRIEDRASPGLAVDDGQTVEVAGDAVHSYEVRLARRGEHTLGPASVRATDSLGLFERTFGHPLETTVLVYPEVESLARAVGVEGEADGVERGAFDRIREYRPGDPLRDIHWTTSAKRPDELVVAEYTDDGSRAITVAAETSVASDAAVDAMATAAASLATRLLESGVAVGVVVRDGTVSAGTGSRHRRDVLELLARAGSGRLSSAAREAADVLVSVDGDGVHVRSAGGTRPYEALVTEGEA